MKPLLPILFAVAATLAVGCSNKTAPAPAGATPTQAAQPQLKAPGEAKVGDKTTCPVMKGHEFVVTDASPKAEYKGKTYYFCCPGCVDEFKQNPAKYVGGV